MKPIPFASPSPNEERDFFAKLFEAYSSDMVRYAAYKLGEPYSRFAEDVVQEAFASLCKNSDTIKNIDPKDHKRFLFSVVKCRVVDILRLEQKNGSLSLDSEPSFPLTAPDPSVESAVEGIELEEKLRLALGQLDEAYRTILELKLVFHLKGSEIAKLLGISEKNAGVRIFRARQKLLQTIEEYTHT